jgi:hypothetical protein
MKELDARGMEFSIGVKQSKQVRALIAQIAERDWVTVEGYPETERRRSPKPGLGPGG